MKSNKIFLVNFLGGIPPRTYLQHKSLSKFGFHAQIIHQRRGQDEACTDKGALLSIDTALFNRIYKIKILKFRLIVGYLEYLLRTAVILRSTASHGDIIQFNHPFLLSLVPMIANRRIRIFYDRFEFYSLVYDELGLLGRILSIVCRKIEDYFLPKIDGIICVNSRKLWLTQRFRQLNSKTLTLWNLPPLYFNKSTTVLNDVIGTLYEKKLIVYAGGLKAKKGIKTLPEIVKIVTTRNPHVHFLIIGSIESCDDPDRWLMQEGIKEKCTYIPWVPPHTLQIYLRASCVGLILLEPRKTYLNLGLGGGRKLFTYMAAGLPVVAPSFGSAWDIINREQIGFQVDTTRPQKVAGAINLLLKDEALRLKMSQKAKQLFRVAYNWDKYEMQYVQHLNSAI